MSVALTRKNLTLDAVQLHALAARRGASESAAAREAIEAALFADEFVDLLRQLREAGFDVDDATTESVDEQAATDDAR
jgi:hypothetical protein